MYFGSMLCWKGPGSEQNGKSYCLFTYSLATQGDGSCWLHFFLPHFYSNTWEGGDSLSL